MKLHVRIGLATLFLAFLLGGSLAMATELIAPPDVERIDTKLRFAILVSQLDQRAASNGLQVVAQYSGSDAATARGTKLPGSTVIMVSSDDLATRVLQADVAAGIELPLRLYVIENPDGTGSLTYRRPSDVFAPYLDKRLDHIAAGLDALFAKIARQAAKP